jgi:uncharacterized cofD-like protein
VRVTGIGGGHGLSATLAAALRYASDVSAVVTVADDGGSSGRLTSALGIPPPGDIRNCLVALAQDSALARLYQHRFSGGPLEGHAVGNIVIAALAEQTGDFAEAVSEAGRILGARGSVHPATEEVVSLMANVGGRVVRGQVAVAQATGAIQALHLEPPQPDANARAIAAILEADQVVLGPGSLFTSLIATLLVPGVGQALRDTEAQRVFVCNARVQMGETRRLDAAGHVAALFSHVGPKAADVVVVQVPELPDGGVTVSRAALDTLGVAVVEADVARSSGEHDPARLAEVLSSL